MKSRDVALYVVLTGLPTALGYIMGPITHTVNNLIELSGIPIPIQLKLGFIWLPFSVLLARALIGKGAAITEGILLGITAIFFHPGKEPFIRLLRDVMLGVGIEVSLIKSNKLNKLNTIIAGISGGFFSYIPYLLFVPFYIEMIAFLLASILILMINHIIASIIGCYIGLIILNRVKQAISS